MLNMVHIKLFDSNLQAKIPFVMIIVLKIEFFLNKKFNTLILITALILVLIKTSGFGAQM